MGAFPNGKEFDGSCKSGGTAEFPLNGVIRCWAEGVQMMKVGGKVRLTCPGPTAYCESGAGGGSIPPDATLVFELDLPGGERELVPSHGFTVSRSSKVRSSARLGSARLGAAQRSARA